MIINLINKQTILLSSLLILFLLVGCSAGNNTQNNISSEDNTAESNEQNNTVNIEENNSEQLEEKEEELNDLQEEIKTKVAELQKAENELSNIEEEIEEKSNQLESGTEEDTNESANGNSDYEVIQEKADSVVIGLESEDFGTVAIHAHPEKGVQFSPYGYVDKNDHLTFTKEELRNFMEDSEEYNWGSEDGSGHPIELTPAEYYEEYIYIRDFSRSASEVNYNETKSRGNTIVNVEEAYPEAHFIEYFVSPDDEIGMNWANLILAFEEHENDWHLVAIVVDRWTI